MRARRNQAPYICPSDRRFNVRVNGEDIENNITRRAAEQYLGQGLGFVQIYLSTRPLEGRKAAWHRQQLPRPATLYTSEVSRAKAWANVRADRSIHVATEPSSYSEQVFAVGAL